MLAAIYARISDDREGAGLGVARQREDCEALIERRGWTLADVYVDNDLSAYAGKPRPGYDRLIEDVRAGTVGAIVAWHPDRLHRSTRELEDFIDVVEASEATVETVTAGTYDLSTPSGRMTARILGATARHESEHKSARARRKHEELARAGAVSGGGTRPFGFERDRVTIRESEAVEIRDAVRRLLTGETAYSILNDWQKRGVVTSTGKQWRTTPFRNMFLSPRIAGLRGHRGEPISDAIWPAIIDRDDWERVRAILSDPRRRRGGRPREYLLTGGLLLCGLCGTRLYAQPKAPKEPGQPSRRCYRCLRLEGGCGGIRCLAEPLDAEVRDVVLAAVDGPDLRETLEASDDSYRELLDQLRADEDALHALEVSHFTEGHPSKPAYLKSREKLTDRIEATKRALAHRNTSETLQGLPLGQGALRDTWEAWTNQQRRRLLQTVLDAIVLHPAVRGRNFFDPNRVEYRWRA